MTDGQVGCPRERFTGKKLLYLKDLELGLSDYAEVWSKPDITNGMKKRSISAIVLYPARNDQGSCTSTTCQVAPSSKSPIFILIILLALSITVALDGPRLVILPFRSAMS